MAELLPFESASVTDTILIVEDDPGFLRLVEVELAAEGLRTARATTAAQAISRFQEVEPVAVLLDLILPDGDGRELLTRFRAERPEIPIVVLTGEANLDVAIECMKLGAADFVPKPFERARLIASVRSARAQGLLRARIETLATELRKDSGLAAIRGEAPATRRLRDLLARAARSDATVLLQGESGTGKEVAARAVHSESERRAGPFVVVDCGAIPEGLVESELFGHEKGAFTGATSARKGAFERADGGTILLDEVAELRLDLQTRLLRVLQDRTFQRVGGGEPRTVDVRVVAATNRDLQGAVAKGRFREDLYYRLSVFPVHLPPLRERVGDIPALAAFFLERAAKRHRRPALGLCPEALAAIAAYPWPGNFRELEHAIERAVLLEDSDTIGLGSLPDGVVSAIEPTRVVTPDANEDGILPFAEEERRILLAALRKTRGNVQEAAARLGIGRATLYRKIESYSLKRELEGDPGS